VLRGRIAKSVLDLDPSASSLDERKFEEERQTKRRELDLKEREIVAREREVQSKEIELARSRWLNPTVIGLFAAAVGLIGSVIVARVNNSNTQEVERLRSEANVTLDAIKTGSGNTDAACKNLTFIVSLGLIRDPEGKIAKQCENAPKGPPSLPVNSETTQLRLKIITATVVDSVTISPVAEALVTNGNGPNTMTNEHGVFTLGIYFTEMVPNPMAYGGHSLVAPLEISKNGYEVLDVNISANDVADQKKQWVFRLHRLGYKK
jgi:hypothetical protein